MTTPTDPSEMTPEQREAAYQRWLEQGPKIAKQRQKEEVLNPLLDGISSLSKLLGTD